jgi:hypothetical protein
MTPTDPAQVPLTRGLIDEAIASDRRPSEVEDAVVVNNLEGPQDQELHPGGLVVRLRS